MKNDGLTKHQRYRLKDLDAYRKRKREYAKTPAQREKRRAYQRLWYAKNAEARQGHKPRQSREVRFNSKIRKDVSGCWLWKGALNADGYGSYCGEKAHRWSYRKWKGEIPEGLVIDHRCRRRHCVNPDHLEVVTNEENIRRGDFSGNGYHLAKLHSSKGQCPKGHPYCGENLRLEKRPDGGVARRCKICDSEKTKRYLKRKKMIW